MHLHPIKAGRRAQRDLERGQRGEGGQGKERIEGDKGAYHETERRT
jgi:hypothetical protein